MSALDSCQVPEVTKQTRLAALAMANVEWADFVFTANDDAEGSLSGYFTHASPARTLALLDVAEAAERLERVVVSEDVPYSEKEPLVRALRECLDRLGRDWGKR